MPKEDQPEQQDRPKKRGRPERMMKFEGTPEEMVKALFARARPVDPSKQKPEKKPPQ